MPLPARRKLLFAIATLPFGAPVMAATATPDFAALEHDLQGELGVTAIHTANGRTVGHRQDQRFPMCSTFKAILAAALLARSVREPGLMDKRIRLPRRGFLGHSPVTEQHPGAAMTVAALCEAIVQVSDNTAANLLLREVSGPAGVTRFARGIGDPAFRLDRTEMALNSALPGDPRDTTTPAAMARTLQTLLLGDALPPAQRDRLRGWMLGVTTGSDRIRAAAPDGWQVADKTGTGGYGATNDIGVLYPPNSAPNSAPDSAPGRAPVVLVIYTRQMKEDVDARADIVAQAARIALNALGVTPRAAT